MTKAEPAIATILIIEDDPEQLRLYSKALRGYRQICVATGTAALKSLAESAPNLILLDHVLEAGELGLDFLPNLRKVAAHVPVIVISGSLDLKQQLQALQGPRSAHYVLEKPVDLDELEQTVETALTECGIGEAIRTLQSLERAEKQDASEPDRRFTECLARQHELLQQLRGTSERPNVSAFARAHKVSRKTIIRDLRDLIRRGQLSAEVFPEWDQPEAESDPGNASD
jgi:DNA-binding NtrC family response regulator